MTWGEAIALTAILAGDWSSQVGAAVAGLERPVTYEYLAIRNLAANYFAGHTKRRAELYPPMPDPFAPRPKRIGNASVSPDQFEAIVAAHREGGDLP